MISVEQGRFRNIDDVNQGFATTLIPNLTRYNEVPVC
jgi:hypothetical protein